MNLRSACFFVIAFLAVNTPTAHAVCPSFNGGVSGGKIQTSLLNEASGITVSRKNNDVFWANNDSGDIARIYAFNSSGTHLGIYNLSGAGAYDYEDIAIGPGPVPGKDYLYIADTGDNGRVRSSVTVYRVEEPTVSSTQSAASETLTGVVAITMVYPGTKYDSETLLVDPVSGDIFLVTRDRAFSGHAYVYRKPAPHEAGVTTLQLVKTINHSVEFKGGDISPSGDKVILRPHSFSGGVNGMLWNRAEGTNLWEAFDSTPCSIPLVSEPQGEAICFDADGCGYYTLSEGTKQPLYYYSTTTPCPEPKQIGDIDGDGIANIDDLLMMAQVWLEDACNQTGLEARWELNGNANDNSGNLYDATIIGDPIWNSQGWVDLSGNDYFQAASYYGVTGTNSRTASAWIKTSSANDMTIIFWGDALIAKMWKFQVVDATGVTGALQVAIGGSGHLVGSTNLRDGIWHHVAAVLKDDGAPNVNQIKLFVDGNRETISTHSGMSIDTGSSNGIIFGAGRINNGSITQHFVGSMSDVRIYNEALSDEQIANLAAGRCAKPNTQNLDGTEGIDYYDLSILSQNWQDSI